MWYFICFMAGGMLGVLAMALACAAGRADDRTNEILRKEKLQ